MKSIAILSGSRLGQGPWRPGKKVVSIAIFGSSTIDFTHAEFDESITEVVALSLFGMNKIIVPDDMPCAVSGITVLGGKSVNRPRAENTPQVSPHKLQVRTIGLVGGFEATEKHPEGELQDTIDRNKN